MKKTALLLAALAVGSFAQAEESKSSYSVTLDFPFTSKYVFRGIELGTTSFQPSVEVATGDLYVGLWTNQPVAKSRSLDPEYDLYAGYGIALTDTLSLDVGGTYYYYPPDDVTDTFEAFVGLNVDAGEFSPAFYVYYDFKLKVYTFEASMGYSIPVEKIGSSLDFSVALGRCESTQDDSYEDYTYYSFGVTLPFALTDTATLSVGCAYASNNTSYDDGNHFYGTVGLSVGF